MITGRRINQNSAMRSMSPKSDVRFIEIEYALIWATTDRRTLVHIIEIEPRMAIE